MPEAALLLLTLTTLPVLVVALVAYLALRGSRPRERADILRALAVFATALLLRSAPPSRRAADTEADDAPPPLDPAGRDDET